LVAAEQELAPTNPQLDRKRQLLATIRGRMAERSEEVGRDFDEMVKNELAKSEKYELVNVKAELEQISLYEHQVRELLRGQDEETIELGRKQLTMMDMQEQMELTKDIYDTVRRRIQELEMERKRPARISVAYFANIIPGKSNRTKYAGAVLFAGLGLGVCLAWLRDKSDQRLRTPEDVERRVGIRIVGTTTNSGQIRKAVQSKQMLEEYQTICTNLGLYEEGIPGRVVVTSPGPREGKTTLAINLATSLAKMGKRVLLIDGDLRKPEIGKLLRIEHPRDGLGDIMSGKDIRESVCLGSQRGLFILTSAACAVGSIYEMITQRRMVEFLASTARTFDHVVIDSPPILAVPDCLLWAKMCDGVMLASIAGRTASPELREAYMRLSQMEIKILGMVLNNVSISRSYNPYGYGYYTGSTCRSSNGGMRRRNMLLPMQRSRIKRDENLVKG